eukprot:4227087-Alexandrium_andersonii.AAC.1
MVLPKAWDPPTVGDPQLQGRALGTPCCALRLQGWVLKPGGSLQLLAGFHAFDRTVRFFGEA